MADLKMTEELKDIFLEMLGELPNITAVARLLDVGGTAVRRARKKDDKFDEAVGEAIEEGYDMLEAEAIRRAKEGVVTEEILAVGEDGTKILKRKTKYSDFLLDKLLRAYRPKKFNPGAKIGFGSDGEKVTMTFNIGGD